MILPYPSPFRFRAESQLATTLQSQYTDAPLHLLFCVHGTNAGNSPVQRIARRRTNRLLG